MPGLTRRAMLPLLASGLVARPTWAESMRPVEGQAIAAYLNSLDVHKPQVKILLIAPRAATAREAFVASEPNADQLAVDLPQATSAVIADFLRAARASTELDIPRHLVRAEIEGLVVSQSSLDRIFDSGSVNDSWPRFYKAYPRASGITRISRVGVDERSGQALFYISMTPGGLGGAGYFVLLDQRFGIWRVLASSNAWVS